MKVLLIDPPGWQKHSINLGLSYLAGTLSLENAEVKIVDMNNNSYPQDALKDIVNMFNPKIIGVSVKTATANASARIASSLKQSFPRIVYVAGGPHITLCAEEFLSENKFFDFGIAGDGEIPLAVLARSLTNNKTDFSKVSGLCHCRNNSFVRAAPFVDPEISRLAFPRFESIIDFDFQDFRYPLLTSRGCPYDCIFCCVGIISGKEWRPRDPENIIQELVAAKNKYQITSFEIMDDNFTFDVNRAKAICQLLIKERLGLDWWCHNGLRADKLDKELLRLMKKAGCKSIAIGIESGDEEIFNTIKKGERLADIVTAVKMIKEVGLECVGYFIVGLPGDSIASTKKTVKFQRRLSLSNYIYNIAVPYPGTKMWEHVKNNGELLSDIKETYHFGDNAKVPFETNRLKAETIEQCYHLANHQGWVYGEKDLQKIREVFKSRYQSDIQRIVFIGDGELSGISKNLKIEYGNADIIEARLDNSLGSHNSRSLLALNYTHSYFEDVFRLSQNGGRLIVNTLTQRLFMQNTANAKEEYIKAEVLPDIRQWGKPEGKYYATHLKYFSPSKQSAKNGVIYKDGIALPFSPVPQWEKAACGKIESGLAFLSLAAYNPNSVYTTDYFSTQLDSPPEELVANDISLQDIYKSETLILENILRESDLLFIPESLASFAHIFSRAKMNVMHYKKNDEESALGYEILETFSPMPASLHHIKRLKPYKAIKVKLNHLCQLRSFIKKSTHVMALWVEIITIVFFTNLKKAFSKIITISR